MSAAARAAIRKAQQFKHAHAVEMKRVSKHTLFADAVASQTPQAVAWAWQLCDVTGSALDHGSGVSHGISDADAGLCNAIALGLGAAAGDLDVGGTRLAIHAPVSPLSECVPLTRGKLPCRGCSPTRATLWCAQVLEGSHGACRWFTGRR